MLIKNGMSGGILLTSGSRLLRMLSGVQGLSVPIVRTLKLPKKETTNPARKLVSIVIVPHAIAAGVVLAFGRSAGVWYARR